MPELVIQRLISAAGNVRARTALSSTVAPAAAANRVLDTIRLWFRRSRERRALAELAARNDYLLQDIGVSRSDAEREAAKPFWH